MKIYDKDKIGELVKIPLPEKYIKDFPIYGDFNLKMVRLVLPDDKYLNNIKRIGVVLHDGNFITEGVMFKKGQYRIIDEDPLNPKEIPMIDRLIYKWMHIELGEEEMDLRDLFNEEETSQLLSELEDLKRYKTFCINNEINLG